MIAPKVQTYRHSKGAVLIVSLILLLAMTLIGVAAIDSSSIQALMAANSQQSRNLYQASLSEIQAQYRKMDSLVYLTQLKNSSTTITRDTHRGISFTGPGISLMDSDFITGSDEDAYTQSGFVTFAGNNDAALKGFSLNDYQVFHYEINTISTVTGSHSMSNQTQGLGRIAPLDSINH